MLLRRRPFRWRLGCPKWVGQALPGRFINRVGGYKQAPLGSCKEKLQGSFNSVLLWHPFSHKPALERHPYRLQIWLLWDPILLLLHILLCKKADDIVYPREQLLPVT